MIFDIYFLDNVLVCALLGVALFCTMWLVTAYRANIGCITRYSRRHDTGVVPNTLPGITLVVYCKDSAEGLDRMLPLVLNQKYPGYFEVIVVTDGRSVQAEDVVTIHGAGRRNLRMTYVPDEARSLSRKKLATTLGIKAARYEYVVLTDANTMPESDQWLALMGRHFAEGKEVVVGNCRITDLDGRGERPFAAFNTLADTATWLSSAVRRRTWRGTDKNLGFSRRLFFENKGFAQSIGYHHGIDDIFVSDISTRENTAVEISLDAQVTHRVHNLKASHLNDKAQHLFTSRRLSHRSRLAFGFGSLLMWVWLAATVALGILAQPNWLPAAISLGLGVVWMATVGFSWSRAARRLGMKLCRPLLPLSMFYRPLSNAGYYLAASSYRKHNYTWAKDF